MIEDEIGESNQTESTAVNETQPTTNPKDTPWASGYPPCKTEKAKQPSGI